jgi:hypothetical protein
MSSPFESFVDLIGQYRKIAAIGIATGVGGPFAAYLVNIAPTNPPGIVLAASVVEITAFLTTCYYLFRNNRRSLRFVGWSRVGFAFAFTLYIFLLTFFTYATPSGQNGAGRSVKGFICREDIANAFPAECPFVGKDMIKDAQYSASNIWTEGSIDAVQFVFIVSWIGIFLFLSVLFASILSSWRSQAAP